MSVRNFHVSPIHNGESAVTQLSSGNFSSPRTPACSSPAVPAKDSLLGVAPSLLGGSTPQATVAHRSIAGCAPGQEHCGCVAGLLESVMRQIPKTRGGNLVDSTTTSTTALSSFGFPSQHDIPARTQKELPCEPCTLPQQLRQFSGEQSAIGSPSTLPEHQNAFITPPVDVSFADPFSYGLSSQGMTGIPDTATQVLSNSEDHQHMPQSFGIMKATPPAISSVRVQPSQGRCSALSAVFSSPGSPQLPLSLAIAGARSPQTNDSAASLPPSVSALPNPQFEGGTPSTAGCGSEGTSCTTRALDDRWLATGPPSNPSLFARPGPSSRWTRPSRKGCGTLQADAAKEEHAVHATIFDQTDFGLNRPDFGIHRPRARLEAHPPMRPPPR